MGGGGAITTQFAPWHWQDKFEARNPEEAHREQLLKIEKQISFSKWLKEKRNEERTRNAAVGAMAAAKLQEEQEERDAKEKERNEDKRRQREDAKQRKHEQKPEPAVERPTFKEWMAKKKREDQAKLKSDTKLSKNQGDSLHKRDDNEKLEIAQRAYDEWMARKQLEDRVKQKLSKEHKLARALDEKLLHAHKWQKKAIVCAYSQNRVEAKRGATTSLLS